MRNFEIWVPLRFLFKIKKFHGPSITHKDNHFAKIKTALKLSVQ